MIRVEDLMIGDWVLLYDKPRKVEIVYDYGRVQVDCIEEDCTALSSIPLTPEILKKNGFSEEGYNMGVVGFSVEPIPDEKDGYEVFIWADMCLQIKHGFTHFKKYIKHVHELQHALRLCGINLEIKL